jgi:nitroreductase
MDVLEAIKGRRSIRAFTDEPIASDSLKRILDAARWSPSGSNQQKWRFVVITSPTTRALVRKFSPGMFAMPAAFIVICVEKDPKANPRAEAVYLADCAIACQNIMLAAYEMGIGSCAVLSFAKVAFREILNLPANIEPLLVVTLGYPAVTPKPPARLELSQIAFMDEYGKEWPS